MGYNIQNEKFKSITEKILIVESDEWRYFRISSDHNR